MEILSGHSGVSLGEPDACSPGLAPIAYSRNSLPPEIIRDRGSID